MKKILEIALFTSLMFFYSISNGKDYMITDFGAVNDGVTLNSKAIQAAIDQANLEGGGKVIIPNGIFLSGTLTLKSNVELSLEKGAVLLGSTDIKDYYTIEGNNALIIAHNQHDITISGEGRIDGQGQELALGIDSLHHSGIKIDKGYNYRRMRPGGRPHLIKFNGCKNAKILGIKAMNAASWVLRFDKCEPLEIDRVHVDSDVFWNNDGIDIEDCKNVRITNSYINSADDGICLKSNDPNSYCDQVYISNNTIRSSASAIKFGTRSNGGFKNVTIEDITIYDTFRSALAFEAVDGGTIENITANNIFASNTGNAIFIKLGQRNVDGEISEIRNISIKNLYVHIPFETPDLNYSFRGPELPFFHNPFPASITGLPEQDVENVSLENINISYPGRANKGYSHMDLWRLDDIPENAAEYPEFHMFGELPAWGFYVRHVNGLSMKDVRLSVRNDDFRPSYVFDDVKNLKLEGGSITSLSDHHQVIIKDTDKTKIHNVKVDGKELKVIPSYGDNTEVLGVELLKKEGID
ncbi:glycoside hydrolase family 28 protein [Echinicola shivajiensis]|uniref:glycoside hydrolase family 28 protein n=1 Tax=Echinicola shivajiensis TaxID=1035916 RepID=UPI001BFC557F|nr:glycosyl hydrolase family 28 protein [Echinicola shivajiensis]